MIITVTHYTNGKGAPVYPPGEEHLSVQDALADMFRRLRAGADTTPSGHNYGLVTYFGADEQHPAGSDTAIYGGLSPKLQDFLIRAAGWWREGEDMELCTPQHDRFIRRLLLEATGHDLSTVDMRLALEIRSEGQFLAAIALAIENGEIVAELFRPGARALP